ncbi:MAG: hypothetical protein JXQ29_00095 [Planctomycetes bacterium]|nr:hypothetical protein [Planctomycetota bacterium]
MGLLVPVLVGRAAAGDAEDRAVFERRRAALAAGDLEGQLELAEWGLARGLRPEARALFRDVLAQDPESARAHRGLGHVFLDGRWSTSAEARAAERALLEAALSKAGLVRFGAEWETAEGARERRAGKVFVDGAWRSPDLARAARGEVKLDGEWIDATRALAAVTGTRLTRLTAEPFGVRVGRHVMVASAGDEAARAALVDAMDGAVKDLLALGGMEEGVLPWELPVRVLWVAKRAELEPIGQWLPFRADRVEVWFRPEPDGTGLRLIRDNEGRPVLVVFAGDDEAAAAAAARCLAVYGITRLAVSALADSPQPPCWIAEGLAASAGMKHAPGGHVSIAGDRPPRVEPAEPFLDLAGLKGYLAREGLIPLAELLALSSATAGTKEVAQAVVFLHHLAESHPRAVAACLKPPASSDAQAGRLEAATGKTIAELEAALRAGCAR